LGAATSLCGPNGAWFDDESQWQNVNRSIDLFLGLCRSSRRVFESLSLDKADPAQKIGNQNIESREWNNKVSVRGNWHDRVGLDLRIWYLVPNASAGENDKTSV
jgi:hypothetical protein